MVSGRTRRLWVALGVVVVVATVWRWWWAPRTELLPEEAYYWTYAQHPAPGYFDHPPMVAWVVMAGTRLWGDTELGVRFVNLWLWVGMVAVMAATGRLWFGERVGAWTGLLVAGLPVFLGMGFVVTPDGALLFFWAWLMYAVSRAVLSGRGVYWWWAGVAGGGALLSKYYAVMLGVSVLLFLVLVPGYRVWLRRWEPWAALGVAMALFSPVILWNEQHEWASFLFQSTRTAGPAAGRTWLHVGEFWMFQLAVLTPLGFALLGLAAWRSLWRGWRGEAAAWSFVLAFGWPVFCLFAAASLKTNIHVNWTAPAFLALAMGGAALWAEAIQSGSARRRWWWVGLGMAGVVLVVAALVVGHWTLATGKPRVFASSRAGGWKKLASRVDEVVAEVEQRTGQRPFVVGADKYNIAAELGFYMRERVECVNLYALGASGLGYRYWTDLEALAGRSAVVVVLTMKPSVQEALRRSFERFEQLEPAAVGLHGKRWRNAHILVGYGYRPRAAEGVLD